ncbi:MAG: hypothetical protein ACTSUE_22480 [Promethearchaeota archaeon]
MKPPLILADWDEEHGPLIIDSIFPENSNVIDDSPEVLITRCYISAQSIFARVPFSKINFNIPMVGIKKLAIVFFDVVDDESVRGDKRPFILVIFAPLDTNYGLVAPISEIVEPYVEKYKDDTIPDLEELQEKLEHLLEHYEYEPVEVTAETQLPPAAGTAGTAGTAGMAGPNLRIRTTVKSGSSNVSRAQTSIAKKIERSSYLDIGNKMFSIRVGPWKPAEIESLEKLVAEGVSSREIAKTIHRTLKDVQQKIELLGEKKENS